MLNYSYEELDSHTLRAKIAARLHSERENAKLSLDALSERTAYSKPTVQSWEKGWKNGTGENHIPNMEQLIDLASIYNCTPEYLLCEYEQKSKPLTDICFETGLLPENIQSLHKPFLAMLEQPMDSHGYAHIMYQFLNHFIRNYQHLADALYHRVIHENITHRFNDSQYKELILEGFSAVTINRSDAFAITFGTLASSVEPMLYTQPMVNYYESKGLDTETIRNIMEEFQSCFKAISSSEKSKVNFALTECFMEIVNSFLDSYPDNVNSYIEFVDKTRAAHINEIVIKGPTIIR